MLYPKININKKETKTKSKKNIKNYRTSIFKTISNYSAFILFLTQKFHF